MQKTGEIQDYARKAREYAEGKLSGELLAHAHGCADMAQKLALRFGLDPNKAAAASYLHDVAKIYTHEQQAELARKLGMPESEIRSYLPQLLHGPVAVLIAREELGIDDAEVLQAIECHSTGCAGLSDVAKVVFTADYIELTRSYPGSTELRSHGHVTLDELTAAVMARKMSHLLDERKIIDPRALEFWNELVRKRP